MINLLNLMLTIDCRDVESIKSELIVYVSDQVAAIPTLKIHEFMLSTLDDAIIDKNTVISAIKEFLESIGESHNFAVISNNDVISIKSISGKIIERDSIHNSELATCNHCGYITNYDVDLQNHMKIHYL